MSTGAAMAFPWLPIPSFAQPGQLHAFVDREVELARLYTGMVNAGNAVRAGKTGASRTFVVTGTKGVGKSALILQALGMIRDTVVEGQRLQVPPDLPEPLDRDRWFILWLSGKHVASVEGIPDAIRRDMLSFLDDVREEVDRKISAVLTLPLFDRLFRTREAADFARVRSAMTILTETIRYVRLFQGSTETLKLERIVQTASSQEAAASLEVQLKAQGLEPVTAEAKAGLKAAASYLRKMGSTSTLSVEAKRVVEAEWATAALNELFAATDAAGIPTLLALDDFDEFASSAGPDHAARAKVLHSVLGAFLGLKPTCFVFALRSEYVMEDIGRMREIVHVPPMTRRVARDALAAWAHVSDLSNAAGAAFVALGDRFLAPFGEDARVVIPFRFLQLVSSVAALSPRERASQTEHQLILDHLTTQGPYELRQIAEDIAKAMPDTDILPCAAASELEPEPYELSDRDQRTLVKYGFLRPAMAGNADDPRIALDSLFAYVRATAPRVTVPGLIAPDLPAGGAAPRSPG